MNISQTFPSLTLPVDFSDGLKLNTKLARTLGENLSGEYCFAEPYPHIVIDNFLPVELAEKIMQNFPEEPLQHDVNHEGGYAGHHKRQILPSDCNRFMRELFDFLNSAPILQFLEGLSTIEGLIPDPYFEGGGLHETSRGGKLGIHADFRIQKKLSLSRRLNMLIYLNKEWKDEYEGKLEIWDASVTTKYKSVSPVFNRCVIFNTDAESYHGHPEALSTPNHITRRSIALYYYTASQKIYEELPSHSTMYAARPNDGSDISKQVMHFNVLNYKNDWLPPAFLKPKLLLPPALYRKIKLGLNKIKSFRKKFKN
jgi:2OG-Fe(II) oxygenase superfamily